MDDTAAGEQTREEGPDTSTNLPSRQHRSSVPSFLFISLILFMLTNNRGDELDTRNHFLEALDALTSQVSNYSAWLNGTTSNYSLPSKDPSTMPLVDVFMTFGSRIDPQQGSYYSNLTGFWKGELHFNNLTSVSVTDPPLQPWRYLADDFVAGINISALPELLGSWNWSASENLTINAGDKAFLFDGGNGSVSGQIATIHGKVDLSDPNAPEELRLNFEGVHFLANGSVYAFAEPIGRHIDLRDIPSLVPEAYINDTAHAIEAELLARVMKLKEKIDAGTLDQDLDNDESPKTRCSFKLYGQLEPSDAPQALMQELEDEIDSPTGISTISPPEMKMNGVLVSQNCGILLEMKHVKGLKSQQLFRKITTYAGISTIVYLILLVLLSRQVARSSSAAGLSRVSRYTFLVQSLVDAISFVGHITLAILADGRPSLAVLAPGGLACMLFIYEAQFAVLIGQIQAPEDVPPPPPLPAPQAPINPHSDTEASSVDNAYPPATLPQTPAPAVATPPTPTTPERSSFLRFLWNHIRTDPSARLWTIISLFLIFVFRIVIILSLPLFFVGTLYSCMWLMQVWRSARRGRSSGLSAEYLIGATLCRLYFALYFLGCPNNILDVEPRRWIYGVACFMFVQICTIMLQEYISPTFFLGNRTVAAKTYDYHPPLPLPDTEAPEQTLGDCAICMDAIRVDPALRRRSKSGDKERGDLLGLGTAAGTRRSGGILGAVGATSARKSYSLAPCHHLFHTACLERWLAIKNICPQCRRPLPPL
ncbi:hypothetical protein AcW1_006950 [Taiwanofungus camphoratus]|nr:hypothetical protein AcW2_005715 [Antrodia cinnamomea]KAI0955342.1 hypothetical protein AcW1_006950 [Antrodia cinnamomea]